jgi:hypothetical protein
MMTGFFLGQANEAQELPLAFSLLLTEVRAPRRLLSPAGFTKGKVRRLTSTRRCTPRGMIRGDEGDALSVCL